MSKVSVEKNPYSRAYIEEIRERVQPIIENVIEPNAEIIDREGKFPRENLEALGEGRLEFGNDSMKNGVD